MCENNDFCNNLEENTCLVVWYDTPTYLHKVIWYEEITIESMSLPKTSHTIAQGWDLHCHSVYSDGTATPEQMVQTAASLGLDGIALADHDTSAGWEDAVRAARSNHMPLIRGTEITADMDGVCVHMLGLLYDPENESVQQLFATTRRHRIERMQQMVRNLAVDFPITWQDVLDMVREGEQTTIGRPHIADALVAKGLFPNRSAVFRNTVNRASKYYVPIISPDARQVVQVIAQAGGVSIIAHPGAIGRNERLLSDEQIAQLARLGLDGLEVHHRDNNAEQQQRLTSIAHHLDLLITGGSDWHGTGKPNHMGEHVTDAQTVQEIIRRGAIGVIE